MSATIRQLPVPPTTLLHRISSAPRHTADGLLRRDGLFDIFPESYWRRFTSLESVSLRCDLREPAVLRLIRRRADGSGEETVLTEVACTAGEVVIRAALASPEAPDSLLLLEVVPQTAAHDPVVTAAWEASRAPDRPVRLGVAITTFNREPFLVANLSRLRGRLAGGSVIVVNHGTPGLQERLRDQLEPDPAIRWIDQENSGGAGGFTRGMVEHRASGTATHVLLMDDDIDLPEDLVERTAAILSYARPEVCLGGAMFDYHRRTSLFSAGDVLLPRSFGIGHVAPAEGADVATPQGVDFLARVHRPDFNGWWCFAFPIEVLDRVGLPMPCFIRGDDVEFGYRLKMAGMPTLGWPGLAVWHMPFADKSAAWHMFYDRRNSLFANARHRRVSRLAAIGKLVGGFTHHLLRYDYDRVNAMTMGIAAFNDGDEKMAGWTHHDHAMLIAATSGMQMRDPAGESALLAASRPLEARKLAGFMRSLRMAGRLARDLVGLPLGDTTPYRMAPGDSWRPDLSRRPALAIECDAQGYATRIFRRDPAESRRATTRCIRALLGMTLRFHQRVRDVPVTRSA